MRRTFSLGALALLLSGSALVPAIADSAQATTREDAAAAEALVPTGTRIAIRDAETAPPAEADPQPLAPPVRIAPTPPPVPSPRIVKVIQGQASWYGPGFYGNRTASGEVLRRGTLTAAHRTLPFGTKVRVTNLRNGRSTVVRINDRGPFHGNRVIDLAHGAASEVGLTASGVTQVKLEVLR